MSRFRKTAKHISELLGDFNAENMSPGLRRGMVLRVWKPVTAKLLGTKDFARHIKRAYLTGNYDNPVLVIVTDNSAWHYQLHTHRRRIHQAINDRLGVNFIQKVILK